MRVSPSFLATRSIEKLAQFDIDRARCSLMPIESVKHTNSSANNLNNNRTCVVVNLLIQASSWLGEDGALANAIKVEDSCKYDEAKARVAVELMATLSQVGVELRRSRKMLPSCMLWSTAIALLAVCAPL
jgi:hypothetical protein